VLVDKATIARDVWRRLGTPRVGVAGVARPDARSGGGRHDRGRPHRARVLLPARAARTYPDHGRAITRLRFDAWLRDDAAAGAEPVTGRVAAVRAGTVELDGINVNSAAQGIVEASAV
jgi:hypothetical protein